MKKKRGKIKFFPMEFISIEKNVMNRITPKYIQSKNFRNNTLSIKQFHNCDYNQELNISNTAVELKSVDIYTTFTVLIF